MSPLGPAYAADPMVPLYLLSALLIAGLGAGVTFYERFGGSSRRYFLLTLIVAAWMAPLGVTHGAATAAAEHVWLRIAYLAMPLMAPAMYTLARDMAERRGRIPGWGVWAVGGAFAILNAAAPWLVEGLQALLVEGTLAGFGWLGALYLAFEGGGVVGSVALVVGSRRGALTGEERQERSSLVFAGLIGALPLLDYFLVEDPFRAGILTPLGLLGGTAIVTAVAVRFRVFAPARSFGTDEVIQTMADAVLVCDAIGRIRSANPAAVRLLERPRSQLVGEAVGEVVGWADEDGRWQPWTELSESTKEELDLRRRDGEPIRVSASIEPIGFGSRPAGAVIVARDIRGQLETQRALRASQRRYSSLFWHNPAILYETDLEGRVVALNPAAEEMLGISTPEVRGEPFEPLIAPEDVESVREMYGGVLEGTAQEYEVTVLTASGGRRQLRGVSIPIFDGPEITGVFGVALDITEQARVKTELEVQRRYFADLFNASPEGIVLLDPGTDEVLRINEEFTRMFGYTPAEALGRRLTELIVPESRWDEGPALNRQARSEGRVRAETVRLRKDRTEVEVSVLARELRIPGEPHQVYGVYRDISARKEAERALREREEELRHAQRLEAVGKLAGGVAHDFNNLLTVINGHARFALEQVPEGSEVVTELEEIERAGGRAASLTQQLLAYSRRQMLNPQVLDPNEVIRELQGMLRRLIGEHIRVETRYADDDARVRVDRGQLEQVLVNLVVNARDAMPDGGTLALELDVLTLEPDDDRVERWGVEPGDLIRIRVVDDGVGMDRETLAHAFEPFFTTKEQGKGTGLGLATVFGIAKQSNGHVVARSEPDAGTTIDILLPRCTEAADAEEPEASTDGEECPGGTVLVVEDEDAVRKLAMKTLEKRGCTVLSAANGVRALDVFEVHGSSIDLVITDLIMPDMGGRELAEELHRRDPDLRVVFMSGYDDALAADGAGASDFLAKPFTPTALVAWVAETLGG